MAHSAKKRLHFGSKSQLPTRLNALAAEDIPTTAKAAFEQYPAIAALGFAVSALETYVYSPGEQREADRLNAELSDFLWD